MSRCCCCVRTVVDVGVAMHSRFEGNGVAHRSLLLLLRAVCMSERVGRHNHPV